MKQDNKKSQFLLEIFVEEIPARLVNELSKQLENNFKKGMNESQIPHAKITSYCTPRRLVITVEGLDKKQKSIEKHIIGPPKKISIDGTGNLLKPGQAFLEKNNIRIEDIKIIKKNNSDFISADIKIVGQNTHEVLTKITYDSITSIKNRKFMKWGSKNFQFIRPIQNLFMLFDSKFLKIDLDGIKNENKVYGHRFYSNKGEKIFSSTEYFEFMKRSYVVLDFSNRKNTIKKQIEKIEKKLKVNVPIDEDLLNHVANLTEYPSVLSGNFDKEFLEVPKEVNISVMKNHQKYFPVFKDKKNLKLDSKFVFVSGSPFLNKKIVISGNEKVIRARLDDAKFFYNEDKNFGLINIQKKLSATTFIENAGTYEDKSKRIHELSGELIKKVELKDSLTDKKLKTTCKILKADLSSQMVYEFPELQGIMGNYYYKDQDPYIAEIIEQHYLPKGRSDSLPTNETAKIISICDKIDTITCCFSLGLVPTGSSDPYGLRRNSIGIIRIAESLDKHINLIDLINLSFKCYEANFDKQVGNDSRNKAVYFFIDRVRNYLTDMGYQTNIINSVLNINYETIDILSIKNKIKSLEEFNKANKLASAIEADKRLRNIVKDNKDLNINLEVFNDPYELKLYKKYIKIKESFSEKIIQNSPNLALNSILDIADDLSDFFENVLVMVENEEVKKNRINLLTNIKILISKFINLSEI